MFNINIPIISKILSIKKIINNNYECNHKEWCEHREKYTTYWNKAGEYIEAINENYSLFINNDLSNYYFSKLLLTCNNYIKIAPILVESQKEENIMGQYHKAMEMCEEAIEQGFPNDKTKYGLAGRIEKIKRKISTK